MAYEMRKLEVLFREDNWRLYANENGDGSVLAHHCFSNSDTWEAARAWLGINDAKCICCGEVAPTNITGLVKLHNFEKMSREV
jgi:hypothetical protein